MRRACGRWIIDHACDKPAVDYVELWYFGVTYKFWLCAEHFDEEQKTRILSANSNDND